MSMTQYLMMMSQLTEKDILRLMKEEWERKVKNLCEEVDNFFDNFSDDPSLISSGLKVKHKKSKLRYTVDSVSKKDVVLLTPEKTKFVVSAEELESDYELG
jgi:hypothetical protein